ncbi:MAG: CRISPR-associated protein Cas5 [Blastocatellia bacterium]|nr:CRISPR-associated protein Cas5 [Blastocatellia bacterium]
MKGFLFDIKGNWAHYRKPETNNNPLTHDFITKTALIGMIGAVLGIDRKAMCELFPQLCEDLLYSVCVKNAVKKESWAFTLRYVVDFFQKAPKQMEFLKNPHNRIALALKSDRSYRFFDDFQVAVQNHQAYFTPVLGLHNCPAELSFVSSGDFHPQKGDFTTQSFVTNKHQLNKEKFLEGFRLQVERIPTFQNSNFWNLPDKYVRVIYPSEGAIVSAEGEYFKFTDESQWVLI